MGVITLRPIRSIAQLRDSGAISATPVQFPADNGRSPGIAFTLRLEQADGTPAEPPTMESTVTNWRTGDTIPLG
jgi:hypothetical protein